MGEKRPPTHYDIADANKLFTEEFFKHIQARAYSDNDIKHENFSIVLNEYLAEVGRIHGGDVAEVLEEWMGKQWAEYETRQKEIARSACEYMRNRDEQEQRKNKAVCDNGVARPQKEIKFVKAITAAELCNMDIAPTQWVVRDILPRGLSMVCAPPKHYKSYLSLDVCIQVCIGGYFMGKKCEQSAALYLDLESTKRRPQNRIRQILGNEQWPENLYLITADEDVGRLGDGFEAQIEFQLQEHKEIKPVVIDVFQMIRQPAKKNQGLYDRDYDDLQTLKKIADKYDVCILLVHHSRKMRDLGDVFNEISGSSGMTGGLDTVWHIGKENRFDDEATLSITGRDLAPAQLKIRFDKEKFRWKCLGTSEQVEAERQQQEYEASPIICTIRKMVKQNRGQWSASASELKSASKYVATQVFDTPEKIGKKINGFKDLLWSVDGIMVDYENGGRNGRKYIFTEKDV